MFRVAARLLLLRILPRRLLPILTVVDALLLFRSLRRRRQVRATPPTPPVRTNDPRESRTAPPQAVTPDAVTPDAVTPVVTRDLVAPKVVAPD